MIGNRDVTIKADRPKSLLLDKHEEYLKQYANDEKGTDQIMAEYLKMSAVYWGMNALYLLSSVQHDSSEAQKMLDFIKQCQNSDGGFAAAPRHDSHLLHTLSAVQVLVILNKCDQDHIDADKCANYVKSLQQDDGSFFGDKWGEYDTRFTFCALATLKLLNRLDNSNLTKAVEFVMSCHNEIDGGFGRLPGSESHSAYVYCCVGSLAIADKIDLIDADQLGAWLSERQLPSGGLNGRPEKLPDLCYSWWCLSSLRMINRLHLIDHQRLMSFIMACQDEEQGGFSDRPGNWVDPYHTMFGIASLSLICQYYDGKDTSAYPEFSDKLDELRKMIKDVNPIFCMPVESLAS